jgi:hypothetical protein
VPKKPDTQTERLAAWLRAHGSITPLEAWSELGIYRLAARINDLRKQNVPIDTETVTVRNRFGEPCTVARYVYEAPKAQAVLF